MKAVDKRIINPTLEKRLTYRYQYWMVAFRKFGGSSSSDAARYMRQKCREVRFGARRNNNYN